MNRKNSNSPLNIYSYPLFDNWKFCADMENNKNDSCKSLSPTNGAHSDSVIWVPLVVSAIFLSQIFQKYIYFRLTYFSLVTYPICQSSFYGLEINLSPYVNFAMKSQFATSHYALYFTFLCLFILLSTYFMLRF